MTRFSSHVAKKEEKQANEPVAILSSLKFNKLWNQRPICS